MCFAGRDVGCKIHDQVNDDDPDQRVLQLTHATHPHPRRHALGPPLGSFKHEAKGDCIGEVISTTPNRKASVAPITPAVIALASVSAARAAEALFRSLENPNQNIKAAPSTAPKEARSRTTRSERTMRNIGLTCHSGRYSMRAPA